MNRLHRSKYSSIVTFLITCLLISGCKTASEKFISPTSYIPNDTSVGVASPSTTSVMLATTQTTAPTRPTGSPTNDATTPKTLTPVITLTPSPTIHTPQPTLSPDEASVLLLDLLENNAGCQLPCWWGITPGETTWSEVNDFLETFTSAIKSSGSGDLLSYYAYYQVPENIFPGTLVHRYLVIDGIVEKIEVIPGYVSTYNISTFLSTYGAPSEVYVFTYSHAREGDLPFDVVLFYPDQGILALYENQAQVVGDRVQGCPQQRSALVFSLWSPREELTFLEATERTVNIRVEGWDGPYYSLQDATGMDIETFYRTFKESDNAICLDTPADLWNPPD